MYGARAVRQRGASADVRAGREEKEALVCWVLGEEGSKRAGELAGCVQLRGMAFVVAAEVAHAVWLGCGSKGFCWGRCQALSLQGWRGTGRELQGTIVKRNTRALRVP